MSGTLAANATVVGHRTVVDCLFKLWVRPDVAPEGWEPGQFFRLGVPVDGADTKREARAYSVAGRDGDVWEFYVVELAGRLQTPRLAKLRAGDRLWFDTRPQGPFTLARNPPGQDLFLIGTGAGIAPYAAFLRHSDLSAYDTVTLVHQVREEAHLAYADVIGPWLAADTRRRYVPIVSQPKQRFASILGHSPLHGRVGAAIADGRVERACGVAFSPARSVVMLSSNPDMIEDVRVVLEARGLTRHLKRAPGNLVAERYW